MPRYSTEREDKPPMVLGFFTKKAKAAAKARKKMGETNHLKAVVRRIEKGMKDADRQTKS